MTEKTRELLKEYSNLNVSIGCINYFDNTVKKIDGTLVEKSARDCALITVNHIIKVLDQVCDDRGYDPFEAPLGHLKEWEKIKEEIENYENWSNSSGMYQGK